MDINENIEYLKAKAGILEKDLADLKKKISDMEDTAKVPEPPNKRWRAEIGERYYIITSGSVVDFDTEDGTTDATHTDDKRYAIGNYFKTEEEAEFEIERLKVINELKDWATANNKNAIISAYTFCIKTEMYHARKKRVINIVTQRDLDVKYVGVREPVYFYTKKDAENAIKAVGEQRILKYYFKEDSSNKEEEN